jgi:hypothetical protein
VAVKTQGIRPEMEAMTMTTEMVEAKRAITLTMMTAVEMIAEETSTIRSKATTRRVMI